MRILFVASRFPYPPLRGDQSRAWHQLRLLSRRHRLTLLVDAGGATAEGREALQALGLELVEVRVPALSRATGLLRGLASGLPLQSALYAAPALRRRLKALLAERRHDLLHVQLARVEPIVPRRAPLPVVVDLIDALSLNMARRGQRDRSLLGRVAALESGRLARFEREICRRRERVTVVSPADRAAVGDFHNLALSANGVDLEAFRPGAERDPAQLVFSGNQGYFPNVDAATWFARDVLPRVRAQQPAAHCVVVGDRPARALRRLAAQQPGIRVTGRVPDLAAVLGGSAVAVAPLRAGSGQLFKVLEALACATPVVATPLALAGLDLEPERHVLVGESADGLARQVLRLLSDRTFAARLAEAGRERVRARYSWERSVAQLERLYDDAVAGWSTSR